MLADYGRVTYPKPPLVVKKQCLQWLKNKQLGTVRSIVLLSKND